MATGQCESFDQEKEQCFESFRSSNDVVDETEMSASVIQRATNASKEDFILNIEAHVSMQIGTHGGISFGSMDRQTSQSIAKGSDIGGPVLREWCQPTGKLSVGRSRTGFPDCEHDHLVQLLVCKNEKTRETLNITDKYEIIVKVTYDGEGHSSFVMPDYQYKRIKSETESGVCISMAGVVGFRFRFHEPNTKYKIYFALKTAPPKKRGKKKISSVNRVRETASEISITLETGSRTLRKPGKPRKEMEENRVALSFAELGPASVSKESRELCKRSLWVTNQLQSRHNDAKWDDFDSLSYKLLLKFPDTDTQITIKLEQSKAAVYRNDLEGSLQLMDEAFTLMPQATNVHLLAARGYGYRAAVARRLSNLGEADYFMQLAEQNDRACHTSLDTSYIAYEKASVLLDFIGLSPQRSPGQLNEALHNLEKCIDVCLRMEMENSGICVQRHHFAFAKIAMLLLDCRTDVARERVLSKELIVNSQECLNTLKNKYWSDITEGLKIQFHLASSDLEYRRGNYTEAERFASLAKDRAEEIGFNSEISLAQERLNYTSVLARREAIGNDMRPSQTSLASASEGENGDVSSSGSESDWLQILE